MKGNFIKSSTLCGCNVCNVWWITSFLCRQKKTGQIKEINFKNVSLRLLL